MHEVRAWIESIWAGERSDRSRMAAEEELRQLLAEIEECDRRAADEEDEAS